MGLRRVWLRSRRALIALGLVGCVVVVASGVAFAAGVQLPFSGSDGNTINGCYDGQGGNLKVLTPSTTKCATGWKSITWNQTGPKGANGTNGTNGTNGINTLINGAPESAGANCADGGLKIQSGLDNGEGGGTANDGTLQAGEVDSTSYVCNGADGAAGSSVSGSKPGPNGNSTYLASLGNGVDLYGGCTGTLPAGAILYFSTGGYGSANVFGFANEDGTIHGVNATGTGLVQVGDIGVDVIDFTGMAGKAGAGTYAQVTGHAVSLGSPNGCTFAWVVTPAA